MPFLSLCCASSRNGPPSEKAEAETRRARIVPILHPSQYNPADYIPQHQRRSSAVGADQFQAPPPRYEDVYYSLPLNGVPRVVVVGDEKDESLLGLVDGSGAVQNIPEDGDSGRRISLQPQSTQHEGSDRSSMISIPSTQVTGLGSSYTGTTTLRGDPSGADRSSVDGSSGRNTLVEDHNSRPPSYYASSLRRRSPSPGSGSESDGDTLWRHPVMREGWFEHLRGTRGDADWRR